MTKVSIELDLEVIQEVIKAKTQDAVVTILARYDLQWMIEEALTTTLKTTETSPTEASKSAFTSFLMSHDYTEAEAFLSEEIIKTTIKEALKTELKKILAENTPAIRAAIEKLIRPERILRNLTTMLRGAKFEIILENDDFSIVLRE